jgi:hypothetical protein
MQTQPAMLDWRPGCEAGSGQHLEQQGGFANFAPVVPAHTPRGLKSGNAMLRMTSNTAVLAISRMRSELRCRTRGTKLWMRVNLVGSTAARGRHGAGLGENTHHWGASPTGVLARVCLPGRVTLHIPRTREGRRAGVHHSGEEPFADQLKRAAERGTGGTIA